MALTLLSLLSAAVLAGALALADPARAAPAPRPDAAAAILIVPSTGAVAYALHPDREREIASTTKLMTALLTARRLKPDHVCTAPAYHAQPAESRIGLEPGERMTVRDLMRALMLPSANDAAATLALCVSGSTSGFVALMNRTARRLGLRHTHYANPIGLDDPENYSTARDLAKLAARDLREPFIRRTVDMPRATLTSGDHVRTVVNRNTLVGEVPWVDGVKTGHTSEAGWVLVGAGTKDGVSLVSAVLGGPTEEQPESDTLALLKWGMSRYERIRLLRRGKALARPTLRYRDGHYVALVPARAPARVVRRGAHPRVVVSAPRDLTGPLGAHAHVGTARVYLGRRLVATVPLVPAASVPAPSLGDRIVHHLRSWEAIALIALILAAGIGSLLIGLRRRRARAAGLGEERSTEPA